jgi:predicted dehydrogenase
MRQFRVGVIGLSMGEGHIRGFLSHPQAKVAAIADIDPHRLREVGDRYKVPVRYDSAETMIAREHLDIVSVATPNRFHKPLTIQALKSGAHVLCEKPMAMNAGEAREMLAVAGKMKRRIMIDFSYRFTQAAQALKAAVNQGVLGDVYYARTMWMRKRGIPGFGGWFGIKSMSGGGPLIDLGVHRIDLALWLMGYPKPEWVLGTAYDRLAAPMARKLKRKFDVEDLAAGFIRFRNGASLEVTASWASNIGENELMETRLVGTRGGLVQRNVGGGYNFEGRLYLDQGGKVRELETKPVRNGLRNAMYHFVDSIAKGKPHIATGEEGAIVMEILDSIYASAKKGAPVRVR